MPTHLKPAATTPPAPATTTTAMGYAHGTPNIDLGLQVGMASPRKILIYYVLLFFFLLATGLLALGSFFTPISMNHLHFSRPTWGVVTFIEYSDFFKDVMNQSVPAEAIYAPCTFLKRYGCNVFTQQTVSYWLANVTNGMQQPFPGILAVSNVSDVIIDACEPFSYAATETSDHLHSADCRPPLPFYADVHSGDAVHRAPTSGVGWREEDTMAAQHGSHARQDWRAVRALAAEEHVSPLYNTTGLRVSLKSTFPDGVQAAFYVTCDGDRNTVGAVTYSIVEGVNMTLVVAPNTTNTSIIVTPTDLVATSPNDNSYWHYNSQFASCEDLFSVCWNTSAFFLEFYTGELRRCGGGPLREDSSYSDEMEHAFVYICTDTSVREINAEPMRFGRINFTVLGEIKANFSRYTTSVSLPYHHTATTFDVKALTAILSVTECLVLLAIILTIITASFSPVQRFKLRQLRAALKADLTIATSAFQAEAQRHDEALPVAAPAPQQLGSAQTPLYVASPLYEPATGSPLMMLAPPSRPLIPEESPYGEGRYLPPSDSEAAAGPAASAKEDDAAFAEVEADAVVAPAEVELSGTAAPAPPRPRGIDADSGDDDARKLKTVKDITRSSTDTTTLFAQTHHLVSPDVLEESTPSTPRSDSDEDGGGDAAPRHYAGPESSPGERSIQLFVRRARNSYRRMRRKQVRHVRALLLYMNVVIIIMAVFVLLTMAFQLSGVFVNFPGRLQFRGGDTLTTSRVLCGGHAALLALSLATSLVCVWISIAIRNKQVW